VLSLKAGVQRFHGKLTTTPHHWKVLLTCSTKEIIMFDKNALEVAIKEILKAKLGLAKDNQKKERPLQIDPELLKRQVGLQVEQFKKGFGKWNI
jgi:hypothetical protein